VRGLPLEYREALESLGVDGGWGFGC